MFEMMTDYLNGVVGTISLLGILSINTQARCSFVELKPQPDLLKNFSKRL
jgi:hypothetical protein